MRRGECPSLFAPMATGDGLLVRVKPPGSVLTAAQARMVAEGALRWGNGVIEATGRASLQVRGLIADGVGPFAASMVAAGLGDGDPAVEARRNIIATPLAGADPAVSPYAGSVASTLAALLAADGRLAALPAKFGFLVDGGGTLGLAGVEADVCIRLDGERCWLAADGAGLAAAMHAAEAAEGAVRLAHAFLQLARGSRRMRGLVGEMGEAAVYAAAGLSGTVPNVLGDTPAAVGAIAYAIRTSSPPGLTPGSTVPQAAPVGAVGPRVKPGGVEANIGAFGVGLPFGTLSASGLQALAGITERHGDGLLRLTPWRVLVIAGVRDPAALRSALGPLNLIAAAADPRLGITACPGRPACASATVDTRPIAAALARLRPSHPVHVSGCSKGCAHAGPAAMTLVGREGAYDLVRNGRASDAPVAFGLTEAQVLAQAIPA